MEKQNLLNELRAYMTQKDNLIVALAQIDGIIAYLNSKLNGLDNQNDSTKK